MSIIGNAITAGGAKKIAVTFSGVGSETVSWTGAETGSTTLTNGSGSAVLKAGAVRPVLQDRVLHVAVG